MPRSQLAVSLCRCRPGRDLAAVQPIPQQLLPTVGADDQAAVNRLQRVDVHQAESIVEFSQNCDVAGSCQDLEARTVRTLATTNHRRELGR
ncbi:hypothetical protein [Kutzneria buriramensis]|uniref:hypothetical protein n=1 Tax=Kutzneria buriramensis TaxID=1045776 RepID=UPI000E22A061